MKSAFHALGIKQGLKIYLTVCHVILHVFKHHRKDESTHVGLYVSAGAILSFFTHFITKFSEKNKHKHNTTLSRPTSTITSQKPAQIHPFLSEYRSVTAPSIFGTRLHNGSFFSITIQRQMRETGISQGSLLRGHCTVIGSIENCT